MTAVDPAALALAALGFCAIGFAGGIVIGRRSVRRTLTWRAAAWPFFAGLMLVAAAMIGLRHAA